MQWEKDQAEACKRRGEKATRGMQWRVTQKHAMEKVKVRGGVSGHTMEAKNVKHEHTLEG